MRRIERGILRVPRFRDAGLAVLLLATMYAAFAGESIPMAFPHYPRIANPPTRLLVVDLSNDRIDGQIAACVLQGIVNRNGGEMVYVLNTYCADNRGGGGRQIQMGQTWIDQGLFDDVPRETLQADPGPNPGFTALLKRDRKFVKGLIVFDPKLEDATIEAATTIAGQTDGVVVSPAMVDELAEFRLPILVDLRENAFKDDRAVLSWLLEHWFPGADHQIAFTWSHMSTDAKSWGGANKDYVVAHRLFTFYLDIDSEEERGHYADVFRRYPPGAPVMGWVNETPYTYGSIQDHGYFIVPYISVENLTVQSAFPSAQGQAVTPRAAPIDDQAVYVAFFVADGDNLEHSLVYEPYGILNSPAFGSVPLTWVINPGIVDLAPRVFAWYGQKMSAAAAPQEMIGMMCDGSPRSDQYTAFATFVAFTQHYLQQAGFLGLKQMEEGEIGAERIQPYVLNSGYSGYPNDLRGLRPYECHLVGNTVHIGSLVPGLGREFGNADNLRQVIRNAPPGPLFLAVFAGTGGGALRTSESCVQALEEDAGGRKPVYLRLSDLAATYRVWKQLPVMPQSLSPRRP